MDMVAKFQMKAGQHVEGVLVPESVAPALADLTFSTGTGEDTALLVFVTDRATLEKQRTRIVKAVHQGRLSWVAYPKAGQLGTDLNRDSLAAHLEKDGIEPVRQIAIDAVWSTLRFKPR
jgi:hypothetical protein